MLIHGPKLPGVHRPTGDAFANLGLEDQQRLREAASKIVEFYEEGIYNLFSVYEEVTSDDEELKVALFQLLNSKIRSAIKDYQKKCSTTTN